MSKETLKQAKLKSSSSFLGAEELEDSMRVVVFSLDKEEYAVPINDVREVLNIPEITPVPESPDFISGIINLRGRVIAIVDLEKRFDLNRDHVDIKPKHVVVTDVEDAPFGIIVDEVVEVLQVPVSFIQDAPKTVRSKIGSKFIRGVVVLQVEEDEEEAQGQAQDEKGEEGKDMTKKKNKKRNKESNRILLIIDIKRLLTAKDMKVVKNADEKQ